MNTPCNCRIKLDLADLLDSLPADALGHDAHGATTCTRCGEGFEFRLFNGRVETGYSYWAGAMHFEALAESRVAGLHLAPSAPDDLVITLGGRQWTFQRRVTSERFFAVLDNLWAAGHTLEELGLEALGVEVIGIERGHQLERTLERTACLAPGERLLLRGCPMALDRAWQRMVRGPARAGGAAGG